MHHQGGARVNHVHDKRGRPRVADAPAGRIRNRRGPGNRPRRLRAAARSSANAAARPVHPHDPSARRQTAHYQAHTDHDPLTRHADAVRDRAPQLNSRRRVAPTRTASASTTQTSTDAPVRARTVVSPLTAPVPASRSWPTTLDATASGLYQPRRNGGRFDRVAVAPPTTRHADACERNAHTQGRGGRVSRILCRRLTLFNSKVWVEGCLGVGVSLRCRAAGRRSGS